MKFLLLNHSVDDSHGIDESQNIVVCDSRGNAVVQLNFPCFSFLEPFTVF